MDINLAIDKITMGAFWLFRKIFLVILYIPLLIAQAFAEAWDSAKYYTDYREGWQERL